jgi:hypothetical protein
MVELIGTMNVLGNGKWRGGVIRTTEYSFQIPLQDRQVGGDQQQEWMEDRKKTYAFHGPIKENPLPSIPGKCRIG